MLVLLTSAHNEADQVGSLVANVAAARVPGQRWWVLDHGSSDDTWQRLQDATRGLDWVQLRRAPPAHDRARACAEGLRSIAAEAEADIVRAGFVGIQDCDIRVPPGYWRTLAAALSEGPSGPNPAPGIVSGALASRGPDGAFRLEGGQRSDWPRGGLRLVRGDLWRALGGVQPVAAWDSAMCIQARVRGERLALLPELVALGVRPTDPRGDGARVRGERAAELGQPPPLVLARALAWGPRRGWAHWRGYRSWQGDRSGLDGFERFYLRQRPAAWFWLAAQRIRAQLGLAPLAGRPRMLPRTAPETASLAWWQPPGAARSATGPG